MSRFPETYPTPKRKALAALVEALACLSRVAESLLATSADEIHAGTAAARGAVRSCNALVQHIGAHGDDAATLEDAVRVTDRRHGAADDLHRLSVRSGGVMPPLVLGPGGDFARAELQTTLPGEAAVGCVRADELPNVFG